MPRKEIFKDIKRIVVKIGSSSITNNNYLSRDKMSVFVRDVATLIRNGCEVVIVSSGSVSAGAGKLQKSRDKISIPEKQALAAVGQTILMNEYRHLFLEEGMSVGQILLTEDDVKNKRRFLNARNTLNTLLTLNVIPIVNENDSVVVSELKVGDNDRLSAYVSDIVEADLLILLSDIDGFYKNLQDEKPIEEINEITDEIKSYAGDSGSKHGTGGMHSKLAAAQMIIVSGGSMIIAKANEEMVLNKIVSGENIGTLFRGNSKILNGRKRWIAFNMKEKGMISVDDGAADALCVQKKSLLAIGITKIEGEFSSGDAVDILGEDSRVIGKGVVNYNTKELKLICGKKTSEIEDILGSNFYDEVIHRDNMIIF